ncbi:MAG: beta-propeller fold lactonase family protein [Ferruginibacter sp.]
MKKNVLLKACIGMAVLFSIASCNKSQDNNPVQATLPKIALEDMVSEKGANPDEAAIGENSVSDISALNRHDGNNGNRHFLYTESNAAGKNEIMRYEVLYNGKLHLDGSTASGGNGTGKALGSQGALALDKDHEWLFAVNAGSNSVSSFKVHNDGSLTLAHTEDTKGMGPVSLTIHGHLLYVLNRGSDAIHGFTIGSGGTFTHIMGSTQYLSSTTVDAPQISFTPDGGQVIVTEKATNIVGSFKVKNDGAVSHGTFTTSVGQTPFGFDFARGRFMVVTNAAGGTAGAGSVSSYINANSGKAKDVNGAVPNGQGAPCWLVVTKFGRFAYASNTGSNNISSYYIAPWGALYLVQAIAGKSGLAPADIVVAANNYYVYALTAKSNSITGFSRKLLGGLTSIGDATGLPASATGLVIY